MAALSSLGECIASWIRGKRSLLVALEAYFDGSNEGGWANGSRVTLAGFAAEDDIWLEIDRQWKRILLAEGKNRPSANYLHMKEAAQMGGEFSWRKGWNAHKVDTLLIDLLMYLQTVDKTKFRYFYTTIDLEAHRRVSAEGIDLPDPVTMLLNVPKSVLTWYFVQYPGVISSAHFFFDKDEPFEEPFKEKWNREKTFSFQSRGNDYVWSMIKTVTTADMRDKPGLQAADMAAWSKNREYGTAGKDQIFKNLSYFMSQIIPSAFLVWDEKTLRERQGRIVPEE